MAGRAANNRARLTPEPLGGYRQADLNENFSALNRRVNTQFARSPYLLGVDTTGATTAASTSEVDLLSVAFRSGIMGPRGMLRITGAVTSTGDADTRTVRLRFGDGTGGAGDPVIGGHAAGTGIGLDAMLFTAYIVNLDAVDSQRCIWQSSFDDLSGDSPIVTTTELTTIDTDATPTGLNTNQAIVLTVTGQTADNADEITGSFLIVELFPEIA